MLLFSWLSDSSRGLVRPLASFHFSFFSVPVPEIQKSVFRIPHEKISKTKNHETETCLSPKAFFKVTYA
jgi:hypothetical protein